MKVIRKTVLYSVNLLLIAQLFIAVVCAESSTVCINKVVSESTLATSLIETTDDALQNDALIMQEVFKENGNMEIPQMFEVLRMLENRIKAINKHPVFVGVAGPSGVGKSYFDEHYVAAYLEKKGYRVKIIDLDNFLHQVTELFGAHSLLEYFKVEEMRAFMQRLRSGAEDIEMPIFNNERRMLEGTQKIKTANIDIFIIEHMWVLNRDPLYGALADFIDIGMYCNADLQLTKVWRDRRMNKKNDEVYQSGLDYAWENMVLPNYQNAIAPTMKDANIVVTFGQNHFIRSFAERHKPDLKFQGRVLAAA